MAVRADSVYIIEMTFEPKEMPIYLPTLEDYESFRAILGHNIPERYSDWLTKVADWEKEYKGRDIRHVRIDPRALSRHLSLSGKAPTLNELLAFTESTAQGSNP